MKFFSLDGLIATLIIFLSLLIFPLLFVSKIFDPAKDTLSEFNLTDIVFSNIRDTEMFDADTNIVLINIEGLDKFSMVDLLSILNEENPKVTGINMILSQSENSQIDDMLAEEIANTTNAVFTYNMTAYDPDAEQFTKIDQSADIFIKSAETAYGNLLIGKDYRFSTVRKAQAKINFNDKLEKSFAFKIAEIYDSAAAARMLARENDYEPINYIGNFEKFFYLEAADILSEDADASLVNDKIVLLGTFKALTTSMLLEDVFFTPLNKKYSGKTYPDMYGTVVQANIISMILNDNYIDFMPAWLSIVITFIITYLNMLLFIVFTRKLKRWYELLSLGVFVVESFAILLLTIFGFHYFNYEIKLTFAIFAVAISVVLYEIYIASLKPLTKELYYKLLNKGA